MRGIHNVGGQLTRWLSGRGGQLVGGQLARG